VVADLSFISLRLVLPALATVAADAAEVVMLVKPQFEAGRADVGKGGVVRDADVWRGSIEGVADACRAAGFAAAAVMASPLRGPAGNVEFMLLALKDGVPHGLDVDQAIAEGLRIGGAA
jgi:23S rRNA (cytidine1920-2'-O)/16S rRNA (cytidine1409-2'-O)-methyltransferase